MSNIDIYIYHTNDLHSQLEQWPKIAGYLKGKKRAHQQNAEDVLIFDIGDHADRSHPLTEATNGKAIVSLLNEAGYDSVTIGNNEGITFSKQQLNCLYENADFHVLLANLTEEDGNTPIWAKEYQLFKLETGVTVAAIGVTAPFYPFYLKLGWKVSNPFNLLPSLLEKVRKEADIIVLLSHLGWHYDEEIATKFPDINIILGAHTHHLFIEGKRVNNTAIAQTGKFGQYIGQVRITYNQERKEVQAVDIGVIEANTLEPSRETQELLLNLTKEKDMLMAEPIAFLEKELEVHWFSPSEAISFVAEALRDWCKTEISMVNAGILLDKIQSGTITKGEIHRICPHPINPCIVTISGKQLQATIELACTEERKTLELKGLGFRGKVLGTMIYSGIDVQVTKTESNVEAVTAITVLGEPLQSEKEYRLATLDMFTFGKLYPDLAAAKEKEYFMPELLRDVMVWKLQKI